MTGFCVKCGRDCEESIEGMCIDCWLDGRKLTAMPHHVDLKVCTGCGEYSIDDRWVRKDLEDAVITAALNARGVLRDAECVGQSVEVTVNDPMTFTVDVTNTGSVEGSDVVQLYITDQKCSVDRPAKELKAFQKVSLKPGETKTVTLRTDRRALSFWDEQAGDWKAEPGDFIAWAGDSSDQLPCKVKFVLK